MGGESRPGIVLGVSVGGLGEGLAECGDDGRQVLVQRLPLAQPPVTNLMVKNVSEI